MAAWHEMPGKGVKEGPVSAAADMIRLRHIDDTYRRLGRIDQLISYAPITPFPTGRIAYRSVPGISCQATSFRPFGTIG